MKNQTLMRLICGLLLAVYALSGAYCDLQTSKIVTEWEQSSQ